MYDLHLPLYKENPSGLCYCMFQCNIAGTSMKFTEIPRDKYPPGSTPEEITKHYLDQSYTLELMISQQDE